MLAQHGNKGEKMLNCGRLSRSEEKEKALGIADVIWGTSVRTDGPVFPADSAKDSNWQGNVCLSLSNELLGWTSQRFLSPQVLL